MKKRLLSARSRPARLPLLATVLLALGISACGAADRAAPTSQSQPQTAQSTSTQRAEPSVAAPAQAVQRPTALPSSPTDTTSASPAPTAVPVCVFNSPVEAEPQAPPLDAYTFSEPKVVLTGQSIGIAEWLPDNTRILISRPVDGGKREAFETLDVQTGITQRYAERAGHPTKPFWMEAEQAVAFAEVRTNNQVVLRIGRGQGKSVDDIVMDLGSPYVTANRDGKQIAFFTKADHRQPQALSLGRARQVRPLVTLPLDQAAKSDYVELESSQALRAAWHPAGDQIAFYNKAGFYLINSATGLNCRVDLGGDNNGKRWALDVQWSPDGRFLAAQTSIGGSKGNLPFVDITVLDTATGATRYITLDVRYIYELAWLPNSRDLIVLGQFDQDSEYVNPSLFITDVSTGNFQRVLPDHTFGAGQYGSQGGRLAVSLDGQRIALKCSLLREDQLCVVDLRTHS